jgi:hypothetical protein
METHLKDLRVIVFHDNGMWVAQALEHDIGAQANDFDTLMSRFEVALKAEIKESIERHGKPLAGIDPAPERFQRMWDRRAQSVDISMAPWMAQQSPNLNLALVA